jgi:hypothetical protein
MNVSITYSGPLVEGVVQCPRTLKAFPFKRGVAISVPELIASALTAQAPEHWSAQKVAVTSAEPTEDKG